MLVGQSCWTVYLGHGVKVHVPRCLNVSMFFVTKNTAIRQVGSALRVRSTHCTPWVLTLMISPNGRNSAVQFVVVGTAVVLSLRLKPKTNKHLHVQHSLLFFNVFFLMYMLSARGRAMTQNESGHNMTKGTVGERGNTNHRVKGESRRRRTNKGCR